MSEITAFPRSNRIDKLDLNQFDRELLCAIFEAIMKEPEKKDINVSLHSFLKLWFDKYHPELIIRDSSSGEIKYNISAYSELHKHLFNLSKLHLIHFSGLTDWSNENEVFFTMSVDGFYAGMGEIKKDEALEIIEITDFLFNTFIQQCKELDMFQADEKKIINILRKKYTSIKTRDINISIRWLRMAQLINYDDPGPDRDKWWVLYGGWRPYFPNEETMPTKVELDEIVILNEIKEICETALESEKEYELKVFISFCDNNFFILELVKKLIGEKIRPIIYLIEPNFGKNIEDDIGERIRDAQFFICILGTKTTLTHYVDNEIGYAFALVHNRIKPNNFIIPVFESQQFLNEYRGFYHRDIIGLILSPDNINENINQIIMHIKKNSPFEKQFKQTTKSRYMVFKEELKKKFPKNESSLERLYETFFIRIYDSFDQTSDGGVLGCLSDNPYELFLKYIEQFDDNEVEKEFFFVNKVQDIQRWFTRQIKIIKVKNKISK